MWVIENIKGWLFRTVMKGLGNHLCSRLIKKLMDSKFSRHLIPIFIKKFGVAKEEIQRPLASFSSLTDFFVREIDPHLRPIDSDPYTVISPVDGYIQSFGDITEDYLFEVKGKEYSFEELTSLESENSGYGGGKYIILYLSPAQYHHFHSPITGEGKQIAELGNQPLPVNAIGWKYGGHLLLHNHRVIFQIQNQSSEMLMVAVGALNVNSIIQNNFNSFWEKGEEIGNFSFGSTVVCLFQKGIIEWDHYLKEEAYLQVGERFACYNRKSDKRGKNHL